MDEGQEAPVTEMTEEQAAEAMAKAGLFAEPGEKPVVKNAAGRPIDPVSKKFLKADKSEGEEPAEEAPAEEAEEAEEAPEGETKEEKEVRLLKLKIDGMEQDVPEEEVKSGYLRQKDYTRKTQELAEERKATAAERAELRQVTERYLTNIQAIQEALDGLSSVQEPDWDAEAKSSTPEEFTRKWNAWKKGAEQRAILQAEQAAAQELREKETKREREARLAQEWEKLGEVIPEWKDPEKGKVLREDLSAYAKSLGFSDDDIGNIEDHRALVILNESRLWRESQKRRPKVEEKVEKAIAGLKPTSPAPRPVAKVAAQAKARAAQTGREDDVAEAMRAAKLFG
jgi:hypothetical protein